MSTNPPLSQRVALILSQSQPSTLYGLPFSQQFNPDLERARGQLWPTGGQKPQAFVWEREKIPMINEQVALLRTLFASLDQAAKDEFPALLVSQLNAKNAKIVAHALVEIRRIEVVATMLATTPKTVVTSERGIVFDGEQLRGFWQGLRLKLAFEAELFTDTDLRTLVSASIGLLHVMPKKYIGPLGDWVPAQVGHGALRDELIAFTGTVDRVRYLRLRDELLAAENPEINTDRQAVISRMQALGFPQEVVTVLDEIERKLQTAATPTGFKECMDLVRSVFERIAAESSARVATANKESAPTGITLNPHKQYLQSRKVFSEKEAVLVQAFYGFLSEEGVHSLGSGPEQARVAKNIAIELALMLLGRVQTRSDGHDAGES
jgi:hypothetical protein